MAGKQTKESKKESKEPAKERTKVDGSFVLTKYEKARMLGIRALQISMGAPFLVKLEPKDMERIAYNPLEIAKLELAQGVLPMKIVRNLPRAGGLQQDDEQEEDA